MKPLRVLVLNLRDRSNPAAGGAEEHLHRLFSRIVARGHRVTLHCGSYSGAPRREVIEGIEVVRRGGRLTNAAWALQYCVSHRRDFDIVVDYTCQLHFLTPLYSRLPRVAMAMHVVGDVYVHDLRLVGSVLAAWEAFSLRFFYAREWFLAISPSTAAELCSHGIDPKQVRILHCGRHEPLPPPNSLRSAQPSLLYYGRLKRYKRVKTVISALPEIRAAVPGTVLEVVGDGDQTASLRKLAAELGVADAVRFHGFLPDAERWRVVGSAWVNVQPSMKEGWGITVLEAAQCGVPSVAFDVPGLRDAIRDGETGLLVPAADIHSLAAATIRLLRDDALRQQLGEAAADWANSFTWDASAEELEAALTEAVGRERTSLVGARREAS